MNVVPCLFHISYMEGYRQPLDFSGGVKAWASITWDDRRRLEWLLDNSETRFEGVVLCLVHVLWAEKNKEYWEKRWAELDRK